MLNARLDIIHVFPSRNSYPSLLAPSAPALALLPFIFNIVGNPSTYFSPLVASDKELSIDRGARVAAVAPARKKYVLRRMFIYQVYFDVYFGVLELKR